MVEVDVDGIIRDGAPIVRSSFRGQRFSNLIGWCKPDRIEPLDDLIAKHKTAIKQDTTGQKHDHGANDCEVIRIGSNEMVPDTTRPLPDTRSAQKGKVVHCKREPYDVYIGRGKCPRTGKTSIWYNKFHIGKDGTREEVIEKHEAWIRKQPKLLAQLHTLKGKVLGCWCKPKACHGDTLLRLIEEFGGTSSV